MVAAIFCISSSSQGSIDNKAQLPPILLLVVDLRLKKTVNYLSNRIWFSSSEILSYKSSTFFLSFFAAFPKGCQLTYRSVCW